MDNSTLLFAIAAIPALLLIFYVYKKDLVEKEPPKLLVKLFLLGGLLSVFMAIILEVIYDGIFFLDKGTYAGLFIYCFFGIGLIEEECKFLVLKAFTWNSKEYKHVFDGIVYAVYVSLGFAFLENIAYVFQYGFTTGLVRGITAIPGHFCFAVFMGAYYGLSKQAEVLGENERVKKLNNLALLTAISIHGLYDFFAFALSYNSLFVISFIAFLIAVYVIAFKKVKTISNVKNNFVQKRLVEEFCSNCGNKLNGKYCAFCGKERG